MSADARRATGAGMLKLYRAYWAFAAGRRLHIAGASALLVASQVVKLASPWLAAQAINAVQVHAQRRLLGSPRTSASLEHDRQQRVDLSPSADGR